MASTAWTVPTRTSSASGGACSVRTGAGRNGAIGSFSQESLDLAQMIEVVSGVQIHEVSDRFLATLAVNTVVIHERRIDATEHAQRAGTCRREELQRFERIGRLVAKRFGPPILIEWLQGHGVVRQDRPEPPGADQLRVREVSKNLRDRPALRFRCPRQLLQRPSHDSPANHHRRRLEHLPWVARAEQRK